MVSLKEPRATVTSNHGGILSMPSARAQVALIWKTLDPEFSESCPVGSYGQQVGDPIWQMCSDPTSVASDCWDYVSWITCF